MNDCLAIAQIEGAVLVKSVEMASSFVEFLGLGESAGEVRGVAFISDRITLQIGWNDDP